MEEKTDFGQALIFNAVGSSPLDIYKRLDCCRILAGVTGVKLDLGGFDPYDPDFYRKYLRVMAVMDSDKGIDYFGEDYGDEDVLKFDVEVWKSIIDVHRITRDFIALASREMLSWQEIDFTG